MRAIAQEIRSAWLPLLLGKGFALCCGLLAIPWTTRLIAPDTYTFYALFLTLTSLASSVLFAGWVRHVSQEWPSARDRPALARLVLSSLVRQRLWLLAVPLATGAALVWLHPHAAWPASVVSLVLANAAMLLGALGIAALQAEKSYWTECRVTVGSSIARSFLPLAAAALLGATPAVLAGGVAGYTALGVLLLLPAWRRSWCAPSPTVVAGPGPTPRELALYALNGLLVWALLVINRWSAGLLLPGEPAGYFNLAATLSFVLPSTLSSASGAIFSPLVYGAASEARTPEAWLAIARKTDARAAVYFALAAGAALAVHLVAPFLVGNLIAAKYASATPWLAASGLYWAALGAHQYYALLLQAAGRHRAVLALNGLSLGVMAAGNAVAGWSGAGAFGIWLAASPLLVLAARAFARKTLATAPGATDAVRSHGT